eukprot:5106484-Prorocentrum_lima.AAC.1
MDFSCNVDWTLPAHRGTVPICIPKTVLGVDVGDMDVVCIGGTEVLYVDAATEVEPLSGGSSSLSSSSSS